MHDTKLSLMINHLSFFFCIETTPVSRHHLNPPNIQPILLSMSMGYLLYDFLKGISNWQTHAFQSTQYGVKKNWEDNSPEKGGDK